MIKKLLRRIELYRNPPKTGDVYLGNPIHFIYGKPTEFILHGLKDKFGNLTYEPIPSKDCYKIIIESCGMLPFYYLCKSEVFCELNTLTFVGDYHKSDKWMPRSQPKRISERLLKSMIINGILQKESLCL